jgi:anti-sigma factor RsiW
LNCRKVNSLLSAYIDAELTGEEMRAVSAHLEDCPSCRLEQESLLETKRLIASLAFRAPRAELESLLLAESGRASQPMASRLLFPLTVWIEEWRERAAIGALPIRPRPIAATALLSVAGLWMASASLDRHNGPDMPDMPSLSVVSLPANITSPPIGAMNGTMLTAVPETPRISPHPYNERVFMPVSSRHSNTERTYIPASMGPGFGSGASILFGVRNEFPSSALRWAH